jgi:hypothetical protein
MLTVLARLTFLKPKNRKSAVLLPLFSGTPVSGGQNSRSDKMYRQPDVVSQLVEAYAHFIYFPKYFLSFLLIVYLTML